MSLATVSTLALAVFLYAFRHSLPFAWTVRVFAAAWRVRLTQRMRSKAAVVAASPVGCTGPAAVTATPAAAPLSAEGCDPFTDTITWHHRATLDECDFMGHLSNSSYPKNLDVARIYYAANRLGDFMRDGGWTPLASTSFTFHNEIPARTAYRVEMRIESWTDKWLYLRSEFRNEAKRDTLYCTAITKHCFKHGRKTIAPWFVLAYCGYGQEANAQTSRTLRRSLGRKRSPLQAYTKLSAYDDINSLYQQSAWKHVAGWETQRRARLQALRLAFIEADGE